MLKQYECPHCQGVLDAERDLVPKQIACPHCGDFFTLGAGAPGPGMNVSGYRIEEKLGSGGMGDVWLATQLSMDRKVALKILPSAMTQRPEEVQAFTREARLLAKLDHPNIVTAFDFGEYAGLYYLAMTYVEGEDLSRRLQKQGTITEPDALGIALKAAQALAYAWTQFKLLHRDVNPANIMIDRYGDVRLMDLGIGKTMLEESDLESETHIIGTPNYMSPEQIEGRTDLDCRADVYSLGATLHHLVTGIVPYDDPNPHKVIERISKETLPAVHMINPDISAECSGLIARLTQHSRDARYASWAEVIEELKQFTVPDRVAPAGQPGEEGLHLAGRKARKAAITAVLMILGGLLIVFTILAVLQHRAVEQELTPLAPSKKIASPDPNAPGTPDKNPLNRNEVEQAKKQAALQKAVREQAARKQNIHNRVHASKAYLQGAEPDFDQALSVLNQLRPEAEAVNLGYLVRNEINRIERMKKEQLPKKPVQKVVEVNTLRALNGQENARLKALRQACAVDVFNREYENALSRIKSAVGYDWPDEGKKKLGYFQSVIEQMAGVGDQVRVSFGKDTGREIIVPFQAGHEKLRVVDAGKHPIRAEIVLRQDGKPVGSIRRDIGIKELELEELVRRAGHAGSPHAPLLRAVMALEHKDYRLARVQLENYNGLFSEKFKKELQQLAP